MRVRRCGRLGYDRASPLRVWCEYPVVAQQGVPGRSDERGQAREQLHRRHHTVRAAAPSGLDTVGNAAIREHAQPIEREAGASAVTNEPLAALIVVGFDPDRRVEIEAVEVRDEAAAAALGFEPAVAVLLRSGAPRKEQLIMKRLNRVRALFGFLRTKRHILFDDAFQQQLEGMYRQTGAGDPPHPPAWLCMVLLLQGYVGASDAEAVEMAVMDRRWQLVLDCLDVEEAPFAQGALQAFRERMIENGMDRVLLERTVALVGEGTVTTAEGQQLTKAVRVAIDSRPFVGAGRVEDTINLLGHAARNIVKLAARLTNRSPEEICRKAGIPLLLSTSIKAGLDIDWSDTRQKASAIQIVEQQVASLERWVEKHLDDVFERPLQPYLEALVTIRDRDLEHTKKDGDRIRQGVAVDRRISIEDALLPSRTSKRPNACT